MTEFTNILENSVSNNLLKYYKGRRRRDRNIHVSDLVDLCPRSLRYSENGAFRPDYGISPASALAFHYGRILQNVVTVFCSHILVKVKCLDCGEHYYTQDYKIKLPCRHGKYSVQEFSMELPINNDISITGSVDCLLNKDDRYYICDIKTIKKDDFDKLVEPSYKYEHQVIAYQWLLSQKGTIKDKAFSKYKVSTGTGYILYLCKDFQQVKMALFEVKKTKYRTHKLLDNTLTQLKSKKLPDRICRSEVDKRASKCPVVNKCFEKKGG